MPTIAWDIDDVLNDLMHRWFMDAWRAGHPGIVIEYCQIVANPPHELLGIESGEYLESLDRFRLSGRYADLLPQPEVLAWFNKYGAACQHVAVTAVPRRCAHVSADWVLRHFGKWIRTFHFVPSPREQERLPAYDTTKADFLCRYGSIDVFVDDSPGNVAAAKLANVRSILFPQPWNDNQRTVADVLAELTALVA